MFAWFQVWLIPLALVGSFVVWGFYLRVTGIRWGARGEQKSPLQLAQELEEREAAEEGARTASVTHGQT